MKRKHRIRKESVSLTISKGHVSTMAKSEDIYRDKKAERSKENPTTIEQRTENERLFKNEMTLKSHIWFLSSMLVLYRQWANQINTVHVSPNDVVRFVYFLFVQRQRKEVNSILKNNS